MEQRKWFRSQFQAFTSNNEAGYTLIELLAALAILLMTVSGTVSMLRTSTYFIENSQDNVIVNQGKMRFFRRMYMDTSNIVAPTFMNTANFQGNGQKIRFFSYTGDEDIVTEIIYSIQAGVKPSELVLIREDKLTESKYEILNNTKLVFQYWDSDRRVWSSTWDARLSYKLPELVQVTVGEDLFTFPVNVGRSFMGDYNGI